MQLKANPLKYPVEKRELSLKQQQFPSRIEKAKNKISLCFCSSQAYGGGSWGMYHHLFNAVIHVSLGT